MAKKSLGGFLKGAWGAKGVKPSVKLLLAALVGYAASYWGFGEVLQSWLGGLF